MRALVRLVALSFAGAARFTHRAGAQIGGRVLGAGAPIAGSTVTLWAADDTAPSRIAQAQSDADGNFELGTPPESVSTLCGGEGVVVFYGMAKPVRAPQIGPATQP